MTTSRFPYRSSSPTINGASIPSLASKRSLIVVLVRTSWRPIQTLLAIADAQNDYAELDPLGKGAREYAAGSLALPASKMVFTGQRQSQSRKVRSGRSLQGRQQQDTGRRVKAESHPKIPTTATISGCSRDKARTHPGVPILISSTAG